MGRGSGLRLRSKVRSALQICTSNLHVPAVDEQFNAVDEAGLVGGEEENGLGDLLRLADAAGWDLAGEIVLGALGLLAATEQIVEAGGLGRARADRVDPDAAFPEIEDPI